MPALQTTYSERMRVAVAGMPADMVTYDADSLIVDTVAGIGFGLAVSKTTASNKILLGSTAANLFRGITVRDVTLIPENLDKYARYDTASVMVRGDIWVAVGSVVIHGEPVTFNSTTGVLSTLAASGTQFTIAGARWMTDQATVGGLAIVRLAGGLPTANVVS